MALLFKQKVVLGEDMAKAGYPSVFVKIMRGKKRGRDQDYNQWVFEAQTTMPCYQQIFKRLKTDMKDDPDSRKGKREAESTVKNMADQHLKGCSKCKEYLASRK